jgi:hypothetical protein
VHPFDPLELDVGGGARPTDPGEGSGRIEGPHCIGYALEDLGGSDDDEVVVGEERERPPSLPAPVIDDDGARLRDGHRARRHGRGPSRPQLRPVRQLVNDGAPLEAVLLALLGGAAGVGAGARSTAIYANTKHELVVIPALAWGGGIGAAVLIGAVSGLWPALRAARMSPTQALWSM